MIRLKSNTGNVLAGGKDGIYLGKAFENEGIASDGIMIGNTHFHLLMLLSFMLPF